MLSTWKKAYRSALEIFINQINSKLQTFEVSDKTQNLEFTQNELSDLKHQSKQWEEKNKEKMIKKLNEDQLNIKKKTENWKNVAYIKKTIDDGVPAYSRNRRALRWNLGTVCQKKFQVYYEMFKNCKELESQSMKTNKIQAVRAPVKTLRALEMDLATEVGVLVLVVVTAQDLQVLCQLLVLALLVWAIRLLATAKMWVLQVLLSCLQVTVDKQCHQVRIKPSPS